MHKALHPSGQFLHHSPPARRRPIGRRASHTQPTAAMSGRGGGGRGWYYKQLYGGGGRGRGGGGGGERGGRGHRLEGVRACRPQRMLACCAPIAHFKRVICMRGSLSRPSVCLLSPSSSICHALMPPAPTPCKRVQRRASSRGTGSEAGRRPRAATPAMTRGAALAPPLPGPVRGFAAQCTVHRAARLRRRWTSSAVCRCLWQVHARV